MTRNKSSFLYFHLLMFVILRIIWMRIVKIVTLFIVNGSIYRYKEDKKNLNYDRNKKQVLYEVWMPFLCEGHLPAGRQWPETFRAVRPLQRFPPGRRFGYKLLR